VADPAQIKSRNKTEGWAELHNGSRIYFMGLDPDPVTGVPSKVGSLDLDWAGVDEAVEVTEADWIMLGGRLRRTAMPYRQLAAATNPASPSHWLKRRFTPPTETHEWVNIVSNRFLPPDYHERLADMGSGFQAQRLAKGLWVAAEGAIWLLPDSQIAELDPHLSGLPMPLRFHRRVAGIDWGYQHAFACEVVAETGTGRKGVVAELYARGRTVPSLIPELVKLREQWQIETFYADPSEPAYIAECRAAGLPIVEATNDVLPGLTAVTDEITKGLLVSPRCAGLLSEIPGYVWQIERGSGMPKDVPQKVNDDACDALRYAVMALRGTVSGKWSLVA
jgi:phage terminase large subunit